MKEGSGSKAGSVLVTNGSGCGSERAINIGADPTDLYPQHWLPVTSHDVEKLNFFSFSFGE